MRTEELKKRTGFLVAAGIAALLGIACAVAFAVLGVSGGIGIVSLPFRAAGRALRALSLSGETGNVFAILIYAILCAVPLAVAACALVRDKRFTAAKLTLVLLSGYSYAALYFFINPNAVRFSVDMSAEARESFLAVVYIGLSFAFYGLLLLSVVFKLVSRAKREEKSFYRLVKILCALIGCAVAFPFFFSELLSLISAAKTGGADAAVGAVSFVLHGGLCALLMAAAYLAYGGARDLDRDLYSQENAALLKRISRLCLWDFLGSISVCVLLNILNFALTSVLTNVRFEFSVSLSVAAISALSLFGCKLLLRAIDLHEENRLTI